MRKILSCSALTILALSAAPVLAQGRQLHFKSKWDQFDLVLSGNGQSATVDGHPADLSAFRELLPLFTDTLNEPCSAVKFKADVTVTEGQRQHLLEFKTGVVREGANCIRVSGDGLLFFPVHRDFFIGAKTDTVPVGKSVQLRRDGQILMKIQRSGSSWISLDRKLWLDWDFTERFLRSLESFTVRHRSRLEMAADKPHVTVQIDHKNYEFYKILTNVWAVKKPGARWLEDSDDWSFWYDLDNTILEDRLAGQIQKLGDGQQKKEERLAILGRIQNSWSPNLRELYHKLILDPNEDAEIKLIAAKRLKSKPSRETALVMAQALAINTDPDFRTIACQALKLQDPKGPLYPSEANEEQAHKVLQYWSTWAEHHKSAQP